MGQKRSLVRLRALTRNVKTSTTIGLWLCALATIGLLIASFLVPPKGVIDPSVLKGGSLISAIAGLFELREAIVEGLGFRVIHGSTTVEVKDLDGSLRGKDEGVCNENTEGHEEV